MSRAALRTTIATLGTMLATLPALAQGSANLPAAAALPDGWRACQAMQGDNDAQLRCFRQWADAQGPRPAAASPAPALASPPAGQPPQAVAGGPPPVNIHVSTATRPCSNRQYSELSRFWELESGTDCENFTIRGYKPISLMWTTSDGANLQPSSPAAGHTAATSTPYRPSEMRLQLSVRTRVANGLLTGIFKPMKDGDTDSLWFGYTQQSYWQLFNSPISRPFRSTDHEPELMYVYPLRLALPGGLTLRMAGLSVNHQSNGQSLPLSRSWNRAIAMAAAETRDFTLQARYWWRLPEAAANDDNPDISSHIGRGEVTGTWFTDDHRSSVALTLRHSVNAANRGSGRLEWFRTIGKSADSDLRWHVSLFHGYGDSLVDYNRKRTVLGVGLSLVDW